MTPKLQEAEQLSKIAIMIVWKLCWLAGSEADRIRKQLYDVVEDEDLVNKLMKSFSPKTDGLARFWIGTVFKRNSDL